MSELLDIRRIAEVLGGDICRGQISAPGPGHSPNDRSMSVLISPGAPDGFVVHSFAGDDPIRCRDHVRAMAGLVRKPSMRTQTVADAQRNTKRHREPDHTPDLAAVKIWREAVS